jgi:hypothetical protein
MRMRMRTGIRVFRVWTRVVSVLGRRVWIGNMMKKIYLTIGFGGADEPEEDDADMDMDDDEEGIFSDAASDDGPTETFVPLRVDALENFHGYCEPK